jgi:oligoendopeptidase F
MTGSTSNIFGILSNADFPYTTVTLSDGKSGRYPVELLKDAGVGMTTDEPLDLTLKSVNRVMDEMERILAKH